MGQQKEQEMSIKQRYDAVTDAVTDDRGALVTFPVTVRAVIGEVTVDPYGDGPPPHVVAFGMIAAHDTPGSYEFPMADGRTCHVEVFYDGEV